MLSRRTAFLPLVCALAWGCSPGSAPPLSAAGDAAVSPPTQDVGTTPPSDTPRPISLPMDEGPHDDPIEWWYYTGRLQTEDGEVLGFEAVVFQFMFTGSPIYVGNAAITDLARQEFKLHVSTSRMDQRARDLPGFDLDAGDVKVSGHGGRDTIKAQVDNYALDLKLLTRKPVAIQNGTGYVKVGTDLPLYYYSYTRMEVSGTVSIDGEPKKVAGAAWMDHQWGMIGMGHAWDWYSLRLDDATEVMIFKVRSSMDPTAAEGPGTVGGTFIDRDGTARALAPEEIAITPKTSWKSPHTGVTYPQDWTISIPSLQLEVDLEAELRDQEFSKSMNHSPVYWEGLCKVSGTRAGEPVKGHAYVELTAEAKKQEED